jgi:hypothetical protein
MFGILLAAVIWSTGRTPERGITRVSLEGIDSEAIDKLEISGKNAVTLKKDGDLWRVESGKEADANAAKRAVEAIPTIVSSDLVTTDEARFAELEVDEEKGARVKAFVGAEEVADFVVGKSAKGGSHVRFGDKVFVAKKLYASTFSREPSSWLQRKLFNDTLADVSRVEVTIAGEKPFALSKTDNTWGLEDESILPKGFRFDKNGASSLASTLVNARAKDILDEDPGVEKTGLDSPDVFAFVIEEGEGDTKSSVRREVKVGKAVSSEDKSVYAQVSGKSDVITLPEHTVKDLRKKPTDFRDLRMMQLDKDKVASVAIKDADKNLVLEKQGAEWKFGKHTETIPDDFNLDPAAVTRRLSAIANARAAKVAEVSAAAAGLGRPSATVTATLEDGKKVTIAFGNETKDGDRDMIYARGNADDAIYLVTKWTRQNLTGGVDTFKKTGDPSGLSNIDPKALQNLPPDVRAGLMKQLQQKKQQQMMIERMQRKAEREAKKEADADGHQH